MTTIGNYILDRKIGEGGMADVYLAKHPVLDRKVAVKVLKPEFIRNENIRKRFLSEARNIFEMSHPNIIKVTDLMDTEDVVAFVMEYVDGGTLKEYIEKKGALSPTETGLLFTQMLDAVGYVHDHGFVHRDIKPSNFMIDTKGRVRLLDFGIAKNTDAKSSEYTSTGTHQQMGTPLYMSPEQVKSTKEVTGRSDIYSLGVVLWQMVTGRKPYDTNTISLFDVQLKIVSEKLADTGTSFDKLIARATEKDPDARYKDCASFSAALKDMHDVKAAPLDTEKTIVGKPASEQSYERTRVGGPPDSPQPENIPPPGIGGRKSRRMGNLLSVVAGIIIIIILGVVNSNMGVDDEWPETSDGDSTLPAEVDTIVNSIDTFSVSFQNNTNAAVFVAIAYHNNGYESHGWWKIEQGESQDIFIERVNMESAIYWYATNDETGYNNPGTDKYFCIDKNNAFNNILETESLQCASKIGFHRLEVTAGYNSCLIE